MAELNHSPRITFPPIRALVFVVLVALFARAVFLLVNGPQLENDTTVYHLLAQNLAQHGAFSLDLANQTPSIRMPPGYPVLLALITLITGSFSPLAICLLQIALDSLVAGLLFLLARRFVSIWISLIAALCYALHPGMISISNTLLSESVFTALLVISVYAIACGVVASRQRWWISALGGCALGLAILFRSIALPLPFLFFGLCFLHFKRPDSRKHGALVLVCALLVVLPWTIRCSKLAHRFVAVQGMSAANFYLATLTDHDQRDEAGLWLYFFGRADTPPADPYGKLLAHARTPEEVAAADRFGAAQIWPNIRKSPRAYLVSRVKSWPFLFLNSFDRFTGINRSYGALVREHDFLRLGIKLLLLCLFSALPFALALIGLFRSRHYLVALLVCSVWLYFLLIHLVLWIEPRFWLPATPLLFVSAAIGAGSIMRRFSGGQLESEEEFVSFRT